MNTSRLFLSIVAAVALAGSVRADSEWLTDLDQAQQKAKADNKLVLLDFTGSDWCGWCIKLHREVFAKPEFREYANKNLVLVELDFPRAKQIDKDLLHKNMKLA
ncbi:MAG: thioredoxin family protein, partial [Chthoniobacterales bacterium]